MITNFGELHQRVKESKPKTVALVAAEDSLLIDAAARAQEEGLARFILLGKAKVIRELTSSRKTEFEIIDAQNPAQAAIDLINRGSADCLMKGKIATGDLLRSILKKESGLRQGELLNHIAVVESPHYHKLLFISDGGINLFYDEIVFEQIVHNIADYLKSFGIQKPRFGMMALVETINTKIPETVIAQRVVENLSGDFIIEGPIAPDVALSAEAAKKKGQKSEIAGEVDVFLMPNTTAANHLVKGLYTLGGCKVGGVIVGAKVPIILLSRANDAESKYRSILLGLV